MSRWLSYECSFIPTLIFSGFPRICQEEREMVNCTPTLFCQDIDWLTYTSHITLHHLKIVNKHQYPQLGGVNLIFLLTGHEKMPTRREQRE